jgi:hypothetical protein
MVENWNFALRQASGDYIFYFTDKMFLLPNTLSYVAEILIENKVEIINWVDSKYYPSSMSDYFGAGVYTEGCSAVSIKKRFIEYDPKEELNKKVFAAVSRDEQDASHYTRGKICFGGYKRQLIDRILDCSDNLFHNISPDYTSMILGLSLATSAIEIRRPGIIHINTDLSNGGQSAISDEFALSFLLSLEGNNNNFFDDMLVPHLYSSVHNMVAHDYISLQRKFGFDYQLNTINWLVYITEDLDISGRIWSSNEVEIRQKRLLDFFIENNLALNHRKEYSDKLEARFLKRSLKQKFVYSLVGKIASLIRSIFPHFLIKAIKRILFPRRLIGREIKCNKLINILDKRALGDNYAAY